MTPNPNKGSYCVCERPNSTGMQVSIHCYDCGLPIQRKEEKCCECGCHTSDSSDAEMKENGCDICYQLYDHKQPAGWAENVKKAMAAMMLNAHKMLWEEITEFGSRTPNFDKAMESTRMSFDDVLAVVASELTAAEQRGYDRGAMEATDVCNLTLEKAVEAERDRIRKAIEGMEVMGIGGQFGDGYESGIRKALFNVLAIVDEKV